MLAVVLAVLHVPAPWPASPKRFSASATTPVAADDPQVCGESQRVEAPNLPRFLRHQGVSTFTVSNTSGAVLSDRVRALTIDARGIWIGYFATERNPAAGLGHYDKRSWADCNQPGATAGANINAIAIDRTGKVWVATEQAGVAVFDGRTWKRYTTSDGLPSMQAYGLTVDDTNDIWVGTWEGIAKFDGRSWSVPYTVQNNTLFNNHAHAITFDSRGDIWVGHVANGISRYSNDERRWFSYTTDNSKLGGNHIRGAVVSKAPYGSQESVWFPTADGGVSKFERGSWTVYNTSNGLPSNDTRTLAVDRYGRVWAATAKGVVYFDGARWITYNTIDTISIAFGPKCRNCIFDNDHIWTGTTSLGLTHSRIPLLRDAIDVVRVAYPRVVTPGQRFRPEVTVVPRAPHQLREDRGDFLSNTDENDANLFGAWPIVAVKGIIEPGEVFTFTDYDNPFRAPQLAAGEDEKTFASTWRVWMHTRYVGPSIPITFTVRRSLQ